MGKPGRRFGLCGSFGSESDKKIAGLASNGTFW